MGREYRGRRGDWEKSTGVGGEIGRRVEGYERRLGGVEMGKEIERADVNEEVKRGTKKAGEDGGKLLMRTMIQSNRRTVESYSTKILTMDKRTSQLKFCK